jgi:hypothetical protein
VERRAPILLLKINVAASFDQLLRDSSMPIGGGNEERSGPNLVLKIYVTASFNQLLCDGHIPIL